MGQRVIPVAVTAEYIGGDGVTLGAAGSHNSVLIEYDFRSAGPQWDDISGRYVLWTNPQGNSTNRINLGVSEKVEGYEGVYQAAPPADAMCVPGWAEMVVVGFTMDGDKEVTKIKTEPSRFRVLPGSSRAADNEGVAPTVEDQLQAEIEAVDDRKVNKPVAPYDKNGTDGQVLFSLGNGGTRWADFEPASVETVEAALAQHPEWTTTVENGAVTTPKLADNAVTKDKLKPGAVGADALDEEMSVERLKATFLDETHFFDHPMLSLRTGGSSFAGVCVIGDRFIVTCRYSISDNTNRLLEVFDTSLRTKVSDATFSESVLGHCNSLTYYDGKIYIATGLSDLDKQIACLDFNPSTYAITFDQYYGGDGRNIYAVAAHDGDFYAITARIDHDIVIIKSTDLETWAQVLRTDLDGVAEKVITQGLDFDGNYLYIPVSGIYKPGGQTMTNAEGLPRQVERIFILKIDGTVCKHFSFKRGSFEEVEDVAVYSKNGNKYLLVGLNQDAYHVSFVHILPIFKDAESALEFGSAGWNGAHSNDYTLLPIYVDTENGTAFGTGTSVDPFPAIEIAFSYIKRFNIRAEIYFTGTANNIEVVNMPQAVNLYFESGSVISAFFIIKACPLVIINGASSTACTVQGQISIEESHVIIKSGIIFDKQLVIANRNWAVGVFRSVLTGNISTVTGYDYLVRALDSICNIENGTITGNTGIASVSGANIVSVNNTWYGRT